MVSTKKEREKHCEKDNIYLKLYQQVPIGWVEERLTKDNKLEILRKFNINDIIISNEELNKRFRKLLKSNKNDEYLKRLNALNEYLDHLNDNTIKLIVPSYNNEEFTKDLTPYQGKRKQKEIPKGTGSKSS